MAKKAYIGIDSVARKIKKGYIGVDNVARRIKKAYIGIGGVARPCFNDGELSYYGAITSLNYGRQRLAAARTASHALFAGGMGIYPGGTREEPMEYVEAYDASLTHTVLNNVANVLTLARYWMGATSVGDYALFGGGVDASGYCNTVDAYDASLVRSNPTGLSLARRELAAASVGNYALFAGGHAQTTAYTKNTVDVYDASLTLKRAASLSEQRTQLVGTSVGDYALFGGGFYKSYTTTVDAYNKSLTQTIPEGFHIGRYRHAATHVGDYAIFAGGANTQATVYRDNIEVYDKSLTHLAPRDSVAAHSMQYGAATSVGDFAIFAGGLRSNQGYTYACAYDISLTRVLLDSFDQYIWQLAAVSIGDYALFGSGQITSSNTKAVYAFSV